MVADIDYRPWLFVPGKRRARKDVDYPYVGSVIRGPCVELSQSLWVCEYTDPFGLDQKGNTQVDVDD